jgi:hypothetical protein
VIGWYTTLPFLGSLGVEANWQEVHCHSRRTVAHQFYERQGYHESPKYFVKLFNDETEAEKEWNKANVKAS